METATKFHLADVARATRIEPSRTGAALALMLLWSQTPASKLRGLPLLEDASAEFMVNDPGNVTRCLAPEIGDELVRGLAAHRPGELEALRRTIIDALQANRPVDEIAEAIISLCAPHAWLSNESPAILIAALNVSEGAQVRCAFSYSMSAAWALSKNSSVDLDIEDASLAPVLAILANASGRSLRVHVNTIYSVARKEDGFGAADDALIFPPIGMRQRLEPSPLNLPGSFAGDQLGSEAFGALWGAHLGKKRNIVVVGNGLLFRTSSKDAAFKQDLIHNHGLEAVLSLPRGTLPGSSVAMSALIFSGKERRNRSRPEIRFIDGSDPTAFDTSALVSFLEEGSTHPLCADASFDQMAEAGFNLSVDRYVLDSETRRSREILGSQETATLSDLAEIRRPQALPRDSGKEPTFEVREALLADIDDGRLSLPAKLSELPRSAAPKIESAILKPGDILLSIKGTIGKAALVTEAAIAESSPVPIVPGQSFVIVRLRKGSLIRDPQVLVSYLRSPIAQSLLQGMAGGTTILNVAMGELKHMPVPIPSLNTQNAIMKEFDEYYKLLRDIDDLRQKMSIKAELISKLILSEK
jgi:hypothetical protein